MSLLISLPTELSAVILQEWIGNMHDICSLDAAFCVHGKLHHFFTSKRFKTNNQMRSNVIREDYLQILQYPHFRLPSFAFSTSKNSTKRMVECLNWMYKRHLKPTVLYLPVAFIPQLVQLENVDCFVSKLKQCYLVGTERSDSAYHRSDNTGGILDGSNLLNSLFSMFFSMENSNSTNSSSTTTSNSSLLCSTTIPSIPPHILIPHVQQFFKKLPHLQSLSCEFYPQINSHFFQLTCLPSNNTHSFHDMNLSHCHHLQDTDISMMIHQYRYSLQQLVLYDHATMTGDCLLTIVQYAQQITSLTLSYCAALQAQNLSIFCMGYTKLQSIQMMGNEILTEEMLYWLFRRNKSLKRVNIIDCKQISKDFVLGLLINDHDLMTKTLEGKIEETGYLMNGIEYLNTDYLLYTNTSPPNTKQTSSHAHSAYSTMNNAQGQQGLTIILKASNQLSSADIDKLFTLFPLPIHHCQFLQTYKLQLHNLWSLLGQTKVKHLIQSFACNPWKYTYPIPGITLPPTTATTPATSTTANAAANEAAIVPSLLIFTQFLEAYGQTMQSLTLPNNPYLLTSTNFNTTNSASSSPTNPTNTTTNTTTNIAVKITIFQQIARHCPSLRILNLHRTPYPLVPPSPKDLEQWHFGLCEILLRCRSLEVLDLSYCMFVNDSCVQLLCDLLDVYGHCLKVKTINLLHTNVTSQSIARILYHDEDAAKVNWAGMMENDLKEMSFGDRKKKKKEEMMVVYMSDNYQYQYNYLTNTMSTVHAQQLNQHHHHRQYEEEHPQPHSSSYSSSSSNYYSNSSNSSNAITTALMTRSNRKIIFH
jgi:hypothetical protein